MFGDPPANAFGMVPEQEGQQVALLAGPSRLISHWRKVILALLTPSSSRAEE